LECRYDAAKIGNDFEKNCNVFMLCEADLLRICINLHEFSQGALLVALDARGGERERGKYDEECDERGKRAHHVTSRGL
jgi:hypothetical protein